MNQPRRHHFIPRFYLKGFTLSGDEADRLYVLDQSKLLQWTSSPTNAAFEKDFYALDAELTTELAAFEKMFAAVETKLTPTLRSTLERTRLPEGDELNVLMNFIMMMAIRVPSIKASLEEFNDTVHKMILRTAVATPQGWESFKQILRQSGTNMDGIDEEQMRKFINSDDYTVTQGPNWYLKMMAEASLVVLPALSARKWGLCIAPAGGPKFICSDFPVSTWWLRNNGRRFPPGLAMRDTAVSIPLSHSITLVGTFDCVLFSGVLAGNVVAGINSATGAHANQIYSATPDFAWLMKDRRIGNATDLLAVLKVENAVLNGDGTTSTSSGDSNPAKTSG